MYILGTPYLNSLDLRILFFILVYINSYGARFDSTCIFLRHFLKLIKKIMNVKQGMVNFFYLFSVPINKHFFLYTGALF